MAAYETEHLERLRRGLAECAVLLRRSGAFPLEEAGEIALYGSGARHTVKGGTGSGEVNSRFFVTVEQGLRNAGFTITTERWLDAYDAVRKEARERFVREIKDRARKNHTIAAVEGMGAVMPEPEYFLPLDGAGDTAVYVLSRISGEGSDRVPAGGDILLSGPEIRDILALSAKYRRFMLVLNVGGPVDLSPVLPAVKDILVLSQLGVETGAALADILLGTAYPSGKLTTTWAAWADEPAIGEFGDINDTRYREGVYVGYRYFDSAGVKPLFPFGFGLGYTDFQVRLRDYDANGETVSVRAEVKNTGAYAGREVVQVYVSCPWGTLDQPYQTLAGFVKTGELAPGASETVTVSFRFSDLASYSEARSAWLLEAGRYCLRLGTSSADTEVCCDLCLGEEVLVRQVRHALGNPGFADWKPDGPIPPASSKDDITVQLLDIPAEDIPRNTACYERDEPVSPELAFLSDEELSYLAVGAFDPKGGPLSVIGNASMSVAGAAGETCGLYRDRGIPALVMADGPAGLRISRDYCRDEKGVHTLGETMPESIAEFLPAPARALTRLTASKPKKGAETLHQYCTAIPIGTAIAQSWNVGFAELCGDIVGEEMARFGVHLWLAPALNIHRSIRCGRNFEYFSEDPLISGQFAAAITRGVQRHPGRGVTIKHFAANNQETNRYNSNSLVSERAMREIYLRGFEICIREAHPAALMTSYNLLNGVHTSERRDLIEDILRAEFGYDGIVMTDWVIGGGTMNRKSVHPAPTPWKVAAAGGDLFMPGGKKDWKNVRDALKAGRLLRKRLEINASRVLRLAKALTGAEAPAP